MIEQETLMRGGAGGFHPQRAPRISSIDLTPRVATNVQGCATIAYISGDLPYIILHLRERTHILKLGDSFPTEGKPCALENPYSRGGRGLSIGFDFPVSIGGNLSQEHRTATGSTVTYNAAAFYENDGEGAGKKKGAGVIQLKGRSSHYVRCSTWGKAYILPKVNAAMLEVKPVGFMDVGLDVRHVSGDTLPTTSFIGGFYDDALTAQWFGAARYNPANQHFVMQDYSLVDIVLDEGMALMVVGEEGKDFELNWRVVDFGYSKGEAFV